MSHKYSHLLLSTAATLTFTALLTAPAIAADAPTGLFLRGAESLGDLSNAKSSSPLEAPNVGAACNAGDGGDTVQCGINSDASGSSATALGANTIASGVGSTAIGNNADAVGSLSTAMGVHSNAGGIGANAIGLRADASGNFSNAIGRNATASGTGSTAIGLDSTASGDYSQSLGRNAVASGATSISMGVDSTASASNSIAIGKGASSTFANSVAIGNGATATRTNQIVLGNASSTYTMTGINSAFSRGQQGAVTGLLTTDANGNLASDGGALQASVADHEVRITGLEGGISQEMKDTANLMSEQATVIKSGELASQEQLSQDADGSPVDAPNVGDACQAGDGSDSLQCGVNADASGSSATALGANTVSSGVGSITVGNNADATGSLSTAIGVHANTSGIGATAIGLRADASGNFAQAIGRNANAAGAGATAIGLDSTASGDYAQSFGRNANASGPASLAMGVDSQATAPDSIAIGNGASATFANSVAIGNDATATRTNQVILGSATSTYTLAGVTSAASRGQQGAVVGILTTDASGNIASDGGALQASVADHEVRITGLEGGVSQEMRSFADDTVTFADHSTAQASANYTTVKTASPVQPARSVAEAAPAELYGSNLEVTTQQGAANSSNIATNAGNIATNAQNVAVTSQRVSVNSQRIASNATSISQNAQRIELAMGSILDNSQAIVRNSEEIAELSSGLAAVTALPDMYLSPDAKWSAAGGVGMYGDDVGIGATLAIRASRNFAIGASVASGGDTATGKLQVRYEGF
ncbi:hypothetical protein [Hellea balneolensis]|uniref:hypothetical protein n=1 Tax=Hellea balneolensis TaxID=287478 RepID=UPI0004101CD8|nr:hypothetical protein [Hellea balneolensis]